MAVARKCRCLPERKVLIEAHLSGGTRDEIETSDSENGRTVQVKRVYGSLSSRECGVLRTGTTDHGKANMTKYEVRDSLGASPSSAVGAALASSPRRHKPSLNRCLRAVKSLDFHRKVEV